MRDVADEKLVSELQDATDALEAEAAGMEWSARDRGVFFEVQSASGRKGERAVAPGVLRKVTSPAKRSKAFQRLGGGHLERGRLPSETRDVPARLHLRVEWIDRSFHVSLSQVAPRGRRRIARPPSPQSNLTHVIISVHRMRL